MNEQEVIKLLNLFADKGIWYFALYIVYHYTGHVIASVILLRLGVFIVKIIDGWVQNYLKIKKEIAEMTLTKRRKKYE